MHTYVREGCTVCGRCAELCLTGAIEKVGYSKESGEIINEVLKDNSLDNIIEVNAESYHPLGEAKCEKLGKKYALPGIDFPSKEMTEEWIRMISSYTTITVKRS